MPIELPMFEDGRGLTMCVCADLPADTSFSGLSKAQAAKYDTPHGEAFASMQVKGKARPILRMSRASAYRTGLLP